MQITPDRCRLLEIETSICQPTASVDEVLAVVQNIGSPPSPTDDPPMLKGALADQLQKVAESHED